jgi:hypothetical protein
LPDSSAGDETKASRVKKSQESLLIISKKGRDTDRCLPMTLTAFFRIASTK